MKTAYSLAALLLLLSVPTTAQENSKLYFLVSGGISQPEAPAFFQDTWKDGTSFGAGAGYRITPHLSFQGLVNYDEFDFDSAGVTAMILDGVDLGPLAEFVDIDISGGSASVLSLSGELKASLKEDPDRVSPYVTIGAGVADVKLSDTTFKTSIFGIEVDEMQIEGASETAAIATAGLGLDMPIGERVGAFVEGRYQKTLTEGDSTDFGSLRVGVRVKR